MIAENDWRHHEMLNTFDRLDSLILRKTHPSVWKQVIAGLALDLVMQLDSLKDLPEAERIHVLIGGYRLCSRAIMPALPREYLFWLLAGHLAVEAMVGPDALICQKDYLGPLWERLEEIHRKHGWPAEGEDGGPWIPEDHLDSLPEDYLAWQEEFSQMIKPMENTAFRAVCMKYGVAEIADLREADPVEYQRRCKLGWDMHQELPGPGD